MRSLFLATLLLAGCGGPARVPFSGRATLDGVPIAKGAIMLVPKGAGTVVTGVIADGSFSLAGEMAPLPGGYRVEIRSSRKSGRKTRKPLGAPGETVDELVEAIALRFNTATTLETDIKRGMEPPTFEVSSK